MMICLATLMVSRVGRPYVSVSKCYSCYRRLFGLIVTCKLGNIYFELICVHQNLVCELWVGVGGFSKVVATFNHVGGSFNPFMVTTGDVWIIPSFRIWGYMLHVERVSCVIRNCGQHQWAIPSLFSIAFKALLEENITRNYYPYLETCSSKFCYSRLLSLFSFLFYRCLFSLFSSGWVVIAVCDYVSVQGTS